ncbi:hypothetical protein G5C51_29435 [Streptomyces sp. A7024]|uniref:Uncharacterized protein n=1 Tax=Streptomyces coryli TaxID=1128680 RepID=A0A6G4U8F8_9ACTN|nr:hypothetical protein [Streptomyces coryli]NGN68010.1 hypothetical protein [Streptomyces coryli]
MSRSKLIAWCCEYLDELREIAAEEGPDRVRELAALMDRAKGGEDCTDDLAPLLRALGQQVSEVRGGGYVTVPGIGHETAGAQLRWTCPARVCDPDQQHDEVAGIRRCAVLDGRPLEQAWE